MGYTFYYDCSCCYDWFYDIWGHGLSQPLDLEDYKDDLVRNPTVLRPTPLPYFDQNSQDNNDPPIYAPFSYDLPDPPETPDDEDVEKPVVRATHVPLWHEEVVWTQRHYDDESEFDQFGTEIAKFVEYEDNDPEPDNLVPPCIIYEEAVGLIGADVDLIEENNNRRVAFNSPKTFLKVRDRKEGISVPASVGFVSSANLDCWDPAQNFLPNDTVSCSKDYLSIWKRDDPPSATRERVHVIDQPEFTQTIFVWDGDNYTQMEGFSHYVDAFSGGSSVFWHQFSRPDFVETLTLNSVNNTVYFGETTTANADGAFDGRAVNGTCRFYKVNQLASYNAGENEPRIVYASMRDWPRCLSVIPPRPEARDPIEYLPDWNPGVNGGGDTRDYPPTQSFICTQLDETHSVKVVFGDAIEKSATKSRMTSSVVAAPADVYFPNPKEATFEDFTRDIIVGSEEVVLFDKEVTIPRIFLQELHDPGSWGHTPSLPDDPIRASAAWGYRTLLYDTDSNEFTRRRWDSGIPDQEPLPDLFMEVNIACPQFNWATSHPEGLKYWGTTTPEERESADQPEEQSSTAGNSSVAASFVVSEMTAETFDVTLPYANFSDGTIVGDQNNVKPLKFKASTPSDVYWSETEYEHKEVVALGAQGDAAEDNFIDEAEVFAGTYDASQVGVEYRWFPHGEMLQPTAWDMGGGLKLCYFKTVWGPDPEDQDVPTELSQGVPTAHELICYDTGSKEEVWRVQGMHTFGKTGNRPCIMTSSDRWVYVTGFPLPSREVVIEPDSTTLPVTIAGSSTETFDFTRGPSGPLIYARYLLLRLSLTGVKLSDLTIRLLDPTGTVDLVLSDRQGGANAATGIKNLCFGEDPGARPIIDAVAGDHNYEGLWLPEESFYDYSSVIREIGDTTWTLSIQNHSSNDATLTQCDFFMERQNVLTDWLISHEPATESEEGVSPEPRLRYPSCVRIGKHPDEGSVLDANREVGFREPAPGIDQFTPDGIVTLEHCDAAAHTERMIAVPTEEFITRLNPFVLPGEGIYGVPR